MLSGYFYSLCICIRRQRFIIININKTKKTSLYEGSPSLLLDFLSPKKKKTMFNFILDLLSKCKRVPSLLLKKPLSFMKKHTKLFVNDNILIVLALDLPYQSPKKLAYIIANKTSLSFYYYYYLKNNPFSISNMYITHDVLRFALSLCLIKNIKLWTTRIIFLNQKITLNV